MDLDGLNFWPCSTVFLSLLSLWVACGFWAEESSGPFLGKSIRSCVERRDSLCSGNASRAEAMEEERFSFNEERFVFNDNDAWEREQEGIQGAQEQLRQMFQSRSNEHDKTVQLSANDAQEGRRGVGEVLPRQETIEKDGEGDDGEKEQSSEMDEDDVVGSDQWEWVKIKTGKKMRSGILRDYYRCKEKGCVVKLTEDYVLENNGKRKHHTKSMDGVHQHPCPGLVPPPNLVYKS